MGLIISVAGFIWTLVAVYRSKNAATQAQEAAERAGDEVLRSSTMVELAAATSALQEIKRLQRNGDWRDLLDRYSVLRSALIAIRASSQVLEEEHQTVIQGAITQIRTIEGKVDNLAVSYL